jgi:hypothetical protein
MKTRNPIGYVLVLLALLSNFGIIKVFADDNPMVARVIYSEASSKCSNQERLMVASVIVNRINHPGFNKPKSMVAVVMAKNQFSCIGDERNKNWEASAGNPNNAAWRHALLLASGDFKPVTNAVYYHDKSISKPRTWDNKYWNASKVAETEHFVFYSASPVLSTKTSQIGKVVQSKQNPKVSSKKADASGGCGESRTTQTDKRLALPLT